MKSLIGFILLYGLIAEIPRDYAITHTLASDNFEVNWSKDGNRLDIEFMVESTGWVSMEIINEKNPSLSFSLKACAEETDGHYTLGQSGHNFGRDLSSASLGHVGMIESFKAEESYGITRINILLELEKRSFLRNHILSKQPYQFIMSHALSDDFNADQVETEVFKKCI